MIAYRVTTQSFRLGDEIPPGHLLSDLSSDRLDVEQVLEAQRPSSKPRRTNAIYVFKKRDAALDWARNGRGRRVYIVEINAVQHEGDWTWVGLIWQESDEAARIALANKYWSSEMTANPTIEFIVSKATVVAEDTTVGATEQLRTVRAKHGIPDPEELFRDRTNPE